MNKVRNATKMSPRSQPEATLAIDKETHRRMLYYMLLTRELEDRVERKLYRQGKVVGGVYVSRGQEAIAVGSCILTRSDDVICPSHRDMGAFLIRGMTPRRILAQYLGRRSGYTGGKDGNLHMGDLGLGIVSFISMLADQVPVSVGVALAFRMRGQDRVALCYFGEGATSRGDWHEGMNLAAVHKLPVVFICNNNQFAYSTPVDRQMPTEHVADRAVAYAMPGIIVDGNDVLAVCEATDRAIRRARAGQGPSLLECKTFRMTGHSAHDDARYVSKDLIAEWETKDPIPRYQRFLEHESILMASEAEQLKEAVVLEIDEALHWAENERFPEPEDGLKGVYFES